jgi:threonine-phosphate decarboxylase
VKFVAQHGGEALALSRRIGLAPERIVDFSLNVNPFGPPANVYDALSSNMGSIKLYPDRSYSDLKSAIAVALKVDASNVIVGCGVTELIHSIMARFIRKGPVVIPLPTFSEYEAAARSLGLKLRLIRPNGIKVDLNSVREAILQGKARCVIICNPNNPTGELLPSDLVNELLVLASDKGVYLIVDETYLDLVDAMPEASLVERAKDYRNLFVLRSLTKPFGFPGLRVGYAVCHKERAEVFESTAISWRVGALEERAAVVALEDQGFLKSSRDRIQREKVLLQRGIQNIEGLKVLDSRTNFLLIDISGTKSAPKNLKWRLFSYGVLVRDLTGVKGLPSKYIRVCVRGREENALLLRALRNVLTSFSKVYSNSSRCDQRPCHFAGQDCRLCFCPFYPCLDNFTGGGFVAGEKGGMVWSCEGCTWIHRREVADLVTKLLARTNIRSSDPERVLSVRKSVLEVHKP